MIKLPRNRILKVLILSILFFNLIGCSTPVRIEVPKTVVQYCIPEKVSVPDKPKYYKLNPSEGIDSVDNFTKLQKNIVLQKNYITLLQNVVSHYEKQIDEFTIMKNNVQKKETE